MEERQVFCQIKVNSCLTFHKGMIQHPQYFPDQLIEIHCLLTGFHPIGKIQKPVGYASATNDSINDLIGKPIDLAVRIPSDVSNTF